MNNEETEEAKEEEKEEAPKKALPRITEVKKYDWEEIANIFVAEANRFQNDIKKIDAGVQMTTRRIETKQEGFMKDRAMAEFVEDVTDLKTRFEELLITYRDFLEIQHKTFLSTLDIAKEHQENIVEMEKEFNRLNETLGAFQTLLIPYINGKPNMRHEDYLRAIRNLIEKEAKTEEVEKAELNKELKIAKERIEEKDKTIFDLQKDLKESRDTLKDIIMSKVIGVPTVIPKTTDETGAPTGSFFKKEH